MDREDVEAAGMAMGVVAAFIIACGLALLLAAPVLFLIVAVVLGIAKG